MFPDIIGFALVSAAVLLAVLVWHISATRRRFAVLFSSVATLEKKVTQSAATQLAAEVAALRADLDEQRSEWAAQRSRLYGKLSALTREEKAAQPEDPADVRDRLRREHLQLPGARR